jgi:hypothetical protein
MTVAKVDSLVILMSGVLRVLGLVRVVGQVLASRHDTRRKAWVQWLLAFVFVL